MLTQEDKEIILGDFPNIKLSYETVVHKKVYNCDFMLAIPIGTKCFAWFTTFQNKYVCIIFELENNKKKEIKNIRIIHTCFSKQLCYGTIVYGTLFNHMNNPFFSIEDIFLYKDRDLSRENWNTKFNTIIEMLKHNIKQTSYNKLFVVFGLPIIAQSNEKLDSILKSDVKYRIGYIQYYQSNKTNAYSSLDFNTFNSKIEEVELRGTISRKETERTPPKCIVLEVKPDIQNDVYHLYSSGNLLCGTACIPDYKTSVMMNKLFRTIKENDDLDKLEESDDEDEFENPNVDKFVNLETSFKMKCHYNKRFKKWVPLEVVNNRELSSRDDMAIFVNNIVSKSIKKYR